MGPSVLQRIQAGLQLHRKPPPVKGELGVGLSKPYRSGSYDNQHPFIPWDDPRYLQQFLSAIYNRRIDDPGLILPLIRWDVAKSTHSVASTLYNLFIMRFIRWISGIGHPHAMKDQQVSSAQYAQGRLDRGLRARLFHLTVTGSKLRLIGTDDECVLHVCHLSSTVSVIHDITGSTVLQSTVPSGRRGSIRRLYQHCYYHHQQSH